MIGFILACLSPQKLEKYNAFLFDNLGKHQLEITTQSAMAQRFFNQGLNLTYRFNYGEAFLPGNYTTRFYLCMRDEL
jgi:hypothetical protein